MVHLHYMYIHMHCLLLANWLNKEFLISTRNFFTVSCDSLFLPPLFLVFFFQSSSSPVFFTSLLTQSSHLSLGLPRLLLPPSRNSAGQFGSLISAFLSTCPAHSKLVLIMLCYRPLPPLFPLECCGLVRCIRNVSRPYKAGPKSTSATMNGLNQRAVENMRPLF